MRTGTSLHGNLPTCRVSRGNSLSILSILIKNLNLLDSFLRRFNEERHKAIGEEVARLLAAGFIVEVFRPEWLANPVRVLKKNGTWRMCVDYMDLNKACPAGPFALPRINQIIDATAGCECLSFLDAYSGYHQIKMAVKDQEKTSFITPFGAFCYVSVPFRLKSAQATY